MTLAITHLDADSIAVVDALRERIPPFSPEHVVQEFSELLTYRISTVTGDRYAGEWPRERFRKLGLKYEVATKPKSDLYRDLLPILNSQRLELLDHPKTIGQLATLERRTARGGKDSIDHAPGGHDDLCNALGGAVVSVAGGHSYHAQVVTLAGFGNFTTTEPTISLTDWQAREARIAREKGIPY
jgi:hypothetical protein